MIFEVRPGPDPGVGACWTGPTGPDRTGTIQGSVCTSSGDAEQPHRFSEPLWSPTGPRSGLTQSKCWSQPETLQNQVPHWASGASVSNRAGTSATQTRPVQSRTTKTKPSSALGSDPAAMGKVSVTPASSHYGIRWTRTQSKDAHGPQNQQNQFNIQTSLPRRFHQNHQWVRLHVLQNHQGPTGAARPPSCPFCLRTGSSHR